VVTSFPKSSTNVRDLCWVSRVSKMSSQASELKSQTTQSNPALTPTITPTSKAKKPAPLPAPGYKRVKVRFPDGQIRTVDRRKDPSEITPEEAILIAEAKNNAKSATDQGSVGKETLQPKLDAGLSSAPQSPLPAAATPSVTSTPEVEAPGNDDKAIEKEKDIAEPAKPAAEVDIQSALNEQQQKNREKRTSRFKNALVRGLATVVGSSVGNVELGDWHHDDVSVDGLESDDEMVDGDGDDDMHHDHDQDHDTSGHHGKYLMVNNIQWLTFEAGGGATLNTGMAGQLIANQILAKSEAKEAEKATPAKPSDTKKGPTEKTTYIGTEKELLDLEKAHDEELNRRPLKRHWANASFYVLASLTVVLPILFVSKYTACNRIRLTYS